MLLNLGREDFVESSSDFQGEGHCSGEDEVSAFGAVGKG